MRKPNPLATVGAPMSLMSNAAPKVAIMVASRCCVYLLQSCMHKIMYSTHLTYSTHSTCHFLKQRCTKMSHRQVYIRIQFVVKRINIGESKISFYLMNMSSSTVYL